MIIQRYLRSLITHRIRAILISVRLVVIIFSLYLLALDQKISAVRVAILVPCTLSRHLFVVWSEITGTTISKFVSYCGGSVIFASLFIVASAVAAAIVTTFVVSVAAAFFSP